jgi:hypothetical protein
MGDRGLVQPLLCSLFLPMFLSSPIGSWDGVESCSSPADLAKAGKQANDALAIIIVSGVFQVYVVSNNGISLSRPRRCPRPERSGAGHSPGFNVRPPSMLEVHVHLTDSCPNHTATPESSTSKKHFDPHFSVDFSICSHMSRSPGHARQGHH